MDAVLTCLVDEKIEAGEMNARLSEAVCSFFESSGAISLESPSLALLYALRSLGCENNAKVMISALAPSWQYFALEAFGFEVLVLDVDTKTGLVDFSVIFEGVKNGAKILILHEPFGLSLPFSVFEQIKSLGIFLIEDVSQSVGAVVLEDEEADSETETLDEKNGQKAGTFGSYSIMALGAFDALTVGGGAVLFAQKKREWTILNQIFENAPKTHLLGDVSSALAYMQFRALSKNDEARAFVFRSYTRSLLGGNNRKNAPFERKNGDAFRAFPVVLSQNFKEAQQYAEKKGVEIVRAFEDSVIAHILKTDGELSADSYPRARSLYLRTALFPLYPRMKAEMTERVGRVLSTLP